MTDNHETPDTSTPPAVEQYFAEHPDIFDVELTNNEPDERQETAAQRFRRLADEITRHRADLNNRLRDA